MSYVELCRHDPFQGNTFLQGITLIFILCHSAVAIVNFPPYRNQLFDLQWESIDWFQNDGKANIKETKIMSAVE